MDPPELIGHQYTFAGPRGAGSNPKNRANVWAFAAGTANADDDSRFAHFGVKSSGTGKEMYHGPVWTEVDKKDHDFWHRDTLAQKAGKEHGFRGYPMYPILAFKDPAQFPDTLADKVGTNVWVWQFLPDKDWVPPMYVQPNAENPEWNCTDAEKPARLQNPFRYGTLRVGIMFQSLLGGKDKGKRDGNAVRTARHLKRCRDVNNHGYTYLQPGKLDSPAGDNRRMLEVVVVYEFDFTRNGLKKDYVFDKAIEGQEGANGREGLDLSVCPGNGHSMNLRSLVAKWAVSSVNQVVRTPNYTLQSLESRQMGHINFLDNFQARMGDGRRAPSDVPINDWRYKGMPKFSKWDEFETKKSTSLKLNVELFHEMSDWFPMAINSTTVYAPGGKLGGIHQLFGFNPAANGAAAAAAGAQAVWPQANITFNRLVQITPHRFRSPGLAWMKDTNAGLEQQVMSYLLSPTGAGAGAGAAAAAPPPPPPSPPSVEDAYEDEDDAPPPVEVEDEDEDNDEVAAWLQQHMSDEAGAAEDEDEDEYAAFVERMVLDNHTVQNSAYENATRRTADIAKVPASADERRQDTDRYNTQREDDSSQAEEPSDDIARSRVIPKRQAPHGDGGGSSAAASARQNPPTENTFVIHVRTPVTHRFPPECPRPTDVVLVQIDSTKSVHQIVEDLYADVEMVISVTKVHTTAFGGICNQNQMIDEMHIPLRNIRAFQTKIREPYKFTIWLSWHANEIGPVSNYIRDKWSMPFDMYYKIYEQKIDDVNGLYEFGKNMKKYALPVRARCKKSDTNNALAPRQAVEWYINDYLPGNRYDAFRTPVLDYRDRSKRQLLETHRAWDDNNEPRRQYNTYFECSAGVYEKPCDRPTKEAHRPGPPKNSNEEIFEYYKLFDLSDRNDGVPTSMGHADPKWRTGKGHSHKVSYIAWNHLLPSVLNEPQFKVYSMVNAFKLIPDDIEMIFGPIPFESGEMDNRYQCGIVNLGPKSDDAWKYMEIMASKIASECSLPYSQCAYIETDNRELRAEYILDYLGPALLSDALVHQDTLHTFDIIAECKPGGRIMGYIACTESTLLENSVAIHAVGANDIQVDLTNGGFSQMFNFSEGNNVNYAQKIQTNNMEPLLPTIFSTVLFKVAFDRAIWAGYKNMDLEALHFSKQSRAFAELMVRTGLVVRPGSIPDTCVVDRTMMTPSDHIVHSECSTGSYIDAAGHMQYLPYNFIGIGLGRNWNEELANNPNDIDDGEIDKTMARIPTITLIRNYWFKGFHLYDIDGQIPIGETDRFYRTLCNQTESPDRQDTYYKATIDPDDIWQGDTATPLPDWYFRVPVGQVDRRAFSLEVQVNSEKTCIPCAPFCGGGIRKTRVANKGLYGCLLNEKNAYKYWHGTNNPDDAVLDNWKRTHFKGRGVNNDERPSPVDFMKASSSEVPIATPPRDNRFYCECHCPVANSDVLTEQQLLRDKAESHYGTLLMRGAVSQSTLLNYIHYPGDVFFAKGGERGHGVDSGLHGWWNVARYGEPRNQKIVTAACRREALFCSMQPRTMWGERQIGGEYQIYRAREPKCTFMSFPNIDDRSKNPWLGLQGEFAVIRKPTPNPRTAGAYVSSMDFNNLYQSRPRSKVDDEHKGKHEKLFGIKSPDNEIVGLRWFQYKLKRKNDGFKILRINYEVIACTPVFNSEIGVSAGTSGFIVASQSIPWTTEGSAHNDLFVHGAAAIASRAAGDPDKLGFFRCQTVLFGDLTGSTNMSLSRVVINDPQAAMIGLVDHSVNGGYQQSLQAPTWRLRPYRFPNRFGLTGIGVYGRDIGARNKWSYATNKNRLQTLIEKDQLKKCLPVSTVNQEEYTVQISMVYRPRVIGKFPEGAALFKEHYRDKQTRGFYPDIVKECTLKHYNVGMRFIRDYYNICLKLRNIEFEKVGRNNGARNSNDEAFLNFLNGIKHLPLQPEHESMFYCSMLGLPIFFNDVS